MRWISATLLMLLSHLVMAQPADSIVQRIILIGDAGDAGAVVNGRAVVIDAARATVPLTKNTTAVFLGDNLYYNGLPCEEDVCYKPGVNVLDTQASLVLGTPATAYFIPGNHDWAQGKPEGYENILRQGQYLDMLAPNVHFFPKDGCPGPEEIHLNNDVTLVIMDSQWWLNRRGRPGIESDCDSKTEEEVLSELKDIVDRNSNKLIIYASHHPFRSTGPHSGYFGLKQHIFPLTDMVKKLYVPLPLIGSIYPISRGVFGSPQDMKFPSYQNMINQVDGVLKTHPYVIHVAGHDHNLQLTKDSSYYYILSGGGCKAQRVGHNKKTKYAAPSMGFSVLEISKNKSVKVSFYEVTAGTGETKLAYTENLLNYANLPPIVEDTAAKQPLITGDSVTVSVNRRYMKASRFKKFIAGKNYRAEWATPVTMRVFRINKEMGGFKVLSVKGGKQTKSMHLEDKNGKKWVLRTINKNPQKAIPQNLRASFAEDIVQDMISASDPYGALGVPPLATALKVAHPTPHYYFVPDDYAFGRYRPLFANSVCALEELEPTINDQDAKSTTKMFNKLLENNDRKVDQRSFLKARMLDFLVADFDRHGDQWKWGSYDSAGLKYYYPIPRDRDQAFFYSDGLLLKLASRSALRFMKGFRYTIPDIEGLGYVERDLDRMYLNELSEDDWKSTLAEFKSAVTDNVIRKASTSFPDRITAMDSGLFAAKLKARRDLLPQRGLDYYKFLSRKVVVYGTNANEYFHVSGNGKRVRVTMYARQANGSPDVQLYTREFNPRITKSLALYGFNGNDYFQVDSNIHSRMKLAIIGGLGEDTFNIKGYMHTSLYDLRKGNNTILAKRHTRNMMSNRAEVNNFTEKYNYNTFKFPTLRVGYNVEDATLVGVGLYSRMYDFRKEPFSSQQSLGALFALQNNAYQVNYFGEFIHFLNKADLELRGDYVNPALNNFFGFGNNTTKDPTKDFYYNKVRFNYMQGDAQARLRLGQNKVSIGVGPSFYHYWYNASDNAGKIMDRPSTEGLDSQSIYNQKTYAGGKLTIRINNLNDRLFPTRGVAWNTEFSSMAGLNSNSKSITAMTSDMTIYSSLTDPARLVAVTRLGMGRIFSQQFEYFQAMSLGQHNYLRGYRKNRFSGDAMAYGSMELRLRLHDVKFYLLPGEFGILGFDDIGRVWMPGESSNKWHNAVGGGLYFMPFNTAFISATVATSPEETLFNFSIGTRLNSIF